MNTRARFEEIWPVPDGVSYANDACGYVPYEFSDRLVYVALEHNARLDTFTRCQDTTDVYASIVDELIGEMEMIRKFSNDTGVLGIAVESIGRAKQKMEQIK